MAVFYITEFADIGKRIQTGQCRSPKRPPFLSKQYRSPLVRRKARCCTATPYSCACAPIVFVRSRSELTRPPRQTACGCPPTCRNISRSLSLPAISQSSRTPGHVWSRRSRQYGRGGTHRRSRHSVRVPAYVALADGVPADVYMDFINNKYYGAVPGGLRFLRNSPAWGDKAGIWTQFAANQMVLTDKGLIINPQVTNSALQCRDLTLAPWVATRLTPTKIATGIDGTFNSATRLTANGTGTVNATMLQSITQASASTIVSFFFRPGKRRRSLSISPPMVEQPGPRSPSPAHSSASVFCKRSPIRRSAFKSSPGMISSPSILPNANSPGRAITHRHRRS